MDKSVIILKKWPSDMKMRCVSISKGMEELFVFKDLLDDYEDEFEEIQWFGDDFQNPLNSF
jgi:hypothetical protein